jgi:alpha/beta superfamily hydrolase
VPPQKVLDWAATLARPPELAVIPGVGHFFHQRLNDLRDTLVTRLGPAVPR